jgi:myxalamid-type nonribosomal peptide synthetase MxaA
VVAGPLRWSIREPTYAPAQAELTLRWDGFATVWLEQDCDGDELAAARLLGHLGVLLEGATAHPGERLPWLPLLTAAERDSLAEWNATAAPYPGERTVHSLIEDQADRTPFTVAVSAGDDHLSYRELDRRANQLAHLLRDRGVGPETLVGVVATRSTGTIVAMLAVLKAGGAYVPLDPDYPPARLRIIRDDADLHLVIAEPDVACLVPDGNQGTIAAGDAARHGYPGTRPAPLAGPANLAYVIYTSGSTGQPKGVLVPHRQIVHSTAARWAHGRFSPGAYAPPVPLSFDASCAAIYWSLCRGGRLVLPTDAAAKDPRLFAKLIKDENVTHLTGMPSFYALVLSAGSHPLRTIRDASIGGEVMPPDVPAEHAHTLPLARLYNDYGPTEATVWSTTHLCRGDERGASVPIGRPIQNVRVHVLDHNLQPVPAGFPGQICIAGEGLARGYLGRLAATAEHFVPDPFGPPGSRMYLTGDLGVLGPDGELEFAGRIDAQVKVRGFRVELTEIESVLREHPGVAAAAVAADRRDGDTRLVAHVVAGNPARPPSDSDLAACLRGQLPGYMVPSKIVFRDSIPVSPTGKIDRAALTTPSRPGPPRSGGPDDVGDVVAAMTEESLDMLLAGLLSPADRDGTVLHPIRPQAGPDLHPTAMEATDMDETGDRTELAVVRNDEEQYSVWRADREPPAGWHPTGFRGPRDACLEHIATVWTDMRPLSLRRAMDG